MNRPEKRFTTAIDDFKKFFEMSLFSVMPVFLILSSTAAYGETKSMFSLIISGGMHVGGITRTEPLDAVSSASKWGGHGGVRTEMGIAGHYFEAGLEYSYFEKELNYEDTDRNIDGTRSFTAHGIALPVLYNFHFFKRENGDANVVLGVGLTGYYFPYQDIEDSGTVSGSDAKSWAAGPCIRVGYYPFAIKEKYSPGFYLNFFRSFNRFYTVDYQDAEAGELAIMGFGISLKIRP